MLESEPEDDEAKARLVEELKARAKREFAQKYMPAAERLWSRAIEPRVLGQQETSGAAREETYRCPLGSQ